jgi:uncharacterized protein YkwD
MSRLIISVFLALGLLLASTSYAQDEHSELSREVLRRINEYRVKKGLSELTWNETITEAAIEHSKYMGNKTIRINHDGFEERMYGLMKALPGRGAAENVANGQHSAEEVVSMWIASPGHRENIEGDYDLSGVGIYKNRNGVLYFTHIFIKKKKVVATAKKAG